MQFLTVPGSSLAVSHRPRASPVSGGKRGSLSSEMPSRTYSEVQPSKVGCAPVSLL